jgi:uncharacterized protein YbjT (DUF2867 family)
VHVVTGAFSYTGSFIARWLLSQGERVRTLSRRPDLAHPLSGRVEFAPLRFELETLTRSLRGASTLYNTYWIRFPRGDVTYATAVENTRVLLRAAADAGVRRIVHVSVTNPSEESPYPYFRHKAILEREIRASPLSHAIVRPTLIFGKGDILINNVAWVLRSFPLFLVPGFGRYRLQPVAGDDVARLAVQLGQTDDEVTVDAAGPDILSFATLVRLIKAATGGRARLVYTPRSLALRAAEIVGRRREDVLLTRHELDGLKAELLLSQRPPTGSTRFEDWLAANGNALGHQYASERQRNWLA